MKILNMPICWIRGHDFMKIDVVIHKRLYKKIFPAKECQRCGKIIYD